MRGGTGVSAMTVANYDQLTCARLAFDLIRSRLPIIRSIAFSSLGPSKRCEIGAAPGAAPVDCGKVRVMIFSRASDSWGVPGALRGEGGSDRAMDKRCCARDMAIE